ncbi:hypothetical protein Micbo1qcDRAFT_158318 [Microdochium bolleyi]|uniref:Uncharacterized protein n=1 Tax=Microdochium bolleyi TaxID=196109 RepID=A0A136JG19_9PEZI|nr:hypothetical protein Micbo1qcDRAFT_158318 [Microdochium bolleyi]
MWDESAQDEDESPDISSRGSCAGAKSAALAVPGLLSPLLLLPLLVFRPSQLPIVTLPTGSLMLAG